ncbi:DUF4222 domain-containing protein [Pantoea dispersa]|nr:DUF4222 domain-containing protein [Pantoea dispersa]
MTVLPSNHIQQLDRAYLDPRGVPVQVTGYDREQQQVIFRRQNYEHECMRPVWQFQQFSRGFQHEPEIDDKGFRHSRG